MKKEIIAFIDELKSNKQLVTFDENTIKQTILMKLLFSLGWDIFNIDEVNPNYPAEKPEVDYCLRLDGTNKILVNVKKADESLEQNQQAPFDFACKENADMFLLTNGTNWWFYLTLDKSKCEQKKFCVLEILSQETDQTAEQLEAFLAKEQHVKGSAVESAEKILNEKNRHVAEETLPEAWKNILSKPHETIVTLLMETTETLCGFAPEKEVVESFLSDLSQSIEPFILTPVEEKTKEEKLNSEPAESKKLTITVKPKQEVKPTSLGYEGKSITSFSFKKKQYSVKSWGNLPLKLCEVLQSEYQQDIEKLLWHSIGNKYYFSRNADELKFPENITGTEIYIQTRQGANEAVRVANSILSFYEYAQEDFSISTES